MVQITQDCPVFPLPVPQSGVSDLALHCPLLLDLVQSRDKTSWHLPEEWEERRFWKYRLQYRARGQGNRRLRDCDRSPEDSWSWRHAGPRTVEIPAMTESHPQQLLSCLSRTHQMQDTQQVFLTLQLQKLEQRPKKPKKQHESKCFQSNPEKILCWVTTSFANRYCEKRPSLPHWILPYLDAILETLKILYLPFIMLFLLQLWEFWLTFSMRKC